MDVPRLDELGQFQCLKHGKKIHTEGTIRCYHFFKILDVDLDIFANIQKW